MGVIEESSMKQKRLEEVITAYWVVGTALRHPDAEPLSTSGAIKLLNQGDRLRLDGSEAKLSEEMHTLKYDIIEGNTEWREKRVVHGSASILPMRR